MEINHLRSRKRYSRIWRAIYKPSLKLIHILFRILIKSTPCIPPMMMNVSESRVLPNPVEFWQAGLGIIKTMSSSLYKTYHLKSTTYCIFKMRVIFRIKLLKVVFFLRKILHNFKNHWFLKMILKTFSHIKKKHQAIKKIWIGKL